MADEKQSDPEKEYRVEDGALASGEGAVAVGKDGIYVPGSVGGDVLGAGATKIINIAEMRDEIKELQMALRIAIANRKAKQTQALMASLKPPEQPYRYLDYFDLGQRSVFFGRKAATEDLLKIIERGRLTLLHAPSGSGKTSLLRAGIQSALIEKGNLPVYLPRPGLHPVQSIRQHILPNPPNPEWFARIPLCAVLGWTCEYLGDSLVRLVIIIDQFEEFFIQTSQSEQQEFVHGLAECLEHPALEPVRFVLALRKDYFSDMALFKPSIPSVFENDFLLPYLTHDGARQAIEEPLENRPIHWATGAVDELLDYLEEGTIEPPHLQLICSRLYDQALEASQSEIHLSGLDLQSIHALYLEEEMAALVTPQFSPAQKELAWNLLKYLVTSSGTKNPRPLSEIYELAPAEDIDPILKRLVDRRLLRWYDDSVSEQSMIEIAHDTLALKIQAHESPDEIRRKAARELIQRGLDDWLSYPSHPLLDLERLKILDEYSKELSLPLLGETASATRNNQAAEFLLRSAVQRGYAIPRWFRLAEQSGVEAELILREGLKAPSFRTRAAVVSALARLGERFIPILCEMLADEYPQVHIAVIAALEKLQPTGEWRVHLKFECYVPAGEFIMGDDTSDEEDEKPAHKVYLDAFYIGKYPVTNAEYKRYCKDIQQPFDLPRGKETHPVVEVSWYDARNYTAWAGMRLLTEAEWEKSASWEPESIIKQQGSLSPSRKFLHDEQPPGKKRKYPWGDEFDPKKCNTFESGIGRTTPVGLYSPQGDSPYECADMAGNVWEWCSSQWADYPYVADDGREEVTGTEGRLRRGGSFEYNASFARCTCREANIEYDRFDCIGFRMGLSFHSTLDSEL